MSKEQSTNQNEKVNKELQSSSLSGDSFTRKEVLNYLNSGVMTNLLRADNKAVEQKQFIYTLQLPHCNLSGIDLRHLNIERANFVGSNMEKIKLESSVLISTNFEWANLKGACFKNANLQKANLKFADLRNCDFENADMQFVTLQGARLDGANLKNVNLQFANLGGCNWRDAQCSEGINMKHVYGDNHVSQTTQL